MEPRHILSYLLRKMHKELGRNNKEILKSDSLKVEDFNKDNALKQFVNIPINKSPIFTFFYGLMKTKSACCNCSASSYLFNYYYYISFDLELALKSDMNSGILSLEQLFKIQNEVCIKVHQNEFKKCIIVNLFKNFYKENNFILYLLY